MCRNLQKSRSNLSHKTLGRLKQQKIYGGIVMAGAREYIIEFGNTPFEEYPFCDADALVLCQIFYMPLERVVSSSFDKAPVALADAANELFNMMGGKYRKLGLMIPKDASKNIMLMAARKRYADVKIQAVEEVFSVNPAIQYAAGTFILPDGTAVVVFRGTDDTISGWKEDLDILIKKGTPSYGYAQEYVEKLAKAHKGNIMLCGHSKGGNIALRTAITVNKKIRSRISGVYNFDGPGYYSSSVLNTAAYDEILPVYKHFVPSGSMIGMMLAHDYDYQAVASTMHIGAFQHDLGTWKIGGGELEKVADTDKLSKLTDLIFAEICSGIDFDFCEALDDVFTSVIDGIDKITLTEFASHPLNSIAGGIKAFVNVSPEIKSQAKQAVTGAGGALKKAYGELKNGEIPSITSLLYAK